LKIFAEGFTSSPRWIPTALQSQAHYCFSSQFKGTITLNDKVLATPTINPAHSKSQDGFKNTKIVETFS